MVVRRLPENSELYHHGVKGQRWGIRHDPAPGTGKKKRSLLAQIKVNRRMKKLRNAKLKNQAAKAKREAIINSGNKHAIKKIQKQLTNEELERAIERIDLNKKLNKIDPSKKAQVAIFIDKYADTAANIGKYMETANKTMKAIDNVKKLKKGLSPSVDK